MASNRTVCTGLYDVAPSLKASITLKQTPTVSLVIEPEIAPVEVPCSNGVTPVTGVTAVALVTEPLSATIEANPSDEVAPSVDRYATEEAIEIENAIENIAETPAAEEIEDFIACEDTVEETLVSAEVADKIIRVTPQVVERMTISLSRDSVTPVTPFALEVALETCPDCGGHEFFPGTRRDVCKRCLNF